MRLVGNSVRNSKVALAAAGVLALGGTAMAAPPGKEPQAPEAPVVAPVTLADERLGLGAGGVIDIDDTHRVAGPDGTPFWELQHAAWDTTGLPAGAVRGDRVRWSLTGVEGPGALTVYEPATGPDHEPVVRFDSADGLPDGYGLPTGARGETRWVFGRPGTYQLTFAAQAEAEAGTNTDTKADAEPETGGGPLIAETRYTVRVGDSALATPVPISPPAPPAGTESPSPTAPVAGTPADAGEDRRPPTPSQAGAGPLAARQAANTTAKPVETAKKVLDQGHIDIAARVVDGKLQINVKDGTVPGKTVWREPSAVVLHVKPQAKKVIPAAKDFAFLGKAGDPVWLLDQVQQPGLLWPGWSTDNIAAGATKGDTEFKLVKADGPGNFALYNYDGLSGAAIRFNSADGVPDAFGVPQNTHAHGGWAFGREGVYRLTFSMTGTLANGAKVSDTETIAFAVGATDPNAVQPGGGSTGGSGSTSGSSTGGTGTGGATGGSGTAGSGTSGSGTGGGSMASTGGGSSLLLGGTAAVLAAVGAGAVHLTRRRTA
ncbi:TIGR03773 family transporter-associated surface protein [Streptomyces sp. Ncost-T10-10d]|uniref:TIGR03773 family transporter-associated surface protein n=1 Tax=Streptomyces sp. Ncost-T10-10d TaxID=1839774 RepID=UPI00081D980E|nr:TIGR03773 family transporter-associated surface protein [Streptomyces sp. Ncost-T10-10d]SCF72138.1 putative ABC transporter-associated repeat protein [Streptomyces sp. Ncost-T10-10d]